MAQPNTTQLPYDEDNILLAISALNKRQIPNVNQAAARYNVPESTLRGRLAGVTPRRDCQANLKKLTKPEEEAVIRHILDLDSQGFSPSLSAIRVMANRLLAERGAEPVGRLWPHNFVKRTERLTTRFNRPYDKQRARCEDPVEIGDWFQRVQRAQAAYGILPEDTYNFDEAGFMMGRTSPQVVVTGTERRGRPKSIQPGNREWATVIQGINAAGWAIPPYLIVVAKHHISAWYEENLPSGWALSVSDNGWTTTDHGELWLRHFIKHTDDRVVGTRRLLLFDGHNSHKTAKFNDLCAENNIYTLCLPQHLSHRLQPLDVGCISLLKTAYGRQIDNLATSYISHITALEFLPAFRAAFYETFTESNIRGGFQGAGLVPFDPDTVLSTLKVVARTPQIPWVSQIPSNTRELEAQSTLLRERIRRHHSSSAESIMEPLNKLTKGVEMIMNTTVLLKARVSALKKANQAATERKGRKRKSIQKHGTLKVAESRKLATQKATRQQVKDGRRQEAAQSGVRQRATIRCSRCKELGHNSRTCKKDTVDTAEH
jgi:hypothetical protein